jgi:hypothetical protein
MVLGMGVRHSLTVVLRKKLQQKEATNKAHKKYKFHYNSANKEPAQQTKINHMQAQNNRGMNLARRDETRTRRLF